MEAKDYLNMMFQKRILNPISILVILILCLASCKVQIPKVTDENLESNDSDNNHPNSDLLEILLPESMKEWAQEVTVKISVRNELRTGVLLHFELGSYYILTCGSLEKQDRYTVTTFDEQLHVAQFIESPSLKSSSLSMLRIQSSRNYPTVKVSPEGPEEGDITFISGFNKVIEDSNAIDKTKFLFGPGRIESKAPTLTYDNPSLPGMEGGPILNKNGELIGIHTSSKRGLLIDDFISNLGSIEADLGLNMASVVRMNHSNFSVDLLWKKEVDLSSFKPEGLHLSPDKIYIQHLNYSLQKNPRIRLSIFSENGELLEDIPVIDSQKPYPVSLIDEHGNFYVTSDSLGTGNPAYLYKLDGKMNIQWVTPLKFYKNLSKDYLVLADHDYLYRVVSFENSTHETALVSVEIYNNETGELINSKQNLSRSPVNYRIVSIEERSPISDVATDRSGNLYVATISGNMYQLCTKGTPRPDEIPLKETSLRISKYDVSLEIIWSKEIKASGKKICRVLRDSNEFRQLSLPPLYTGWTLKLHVDEAENVYVAGITDENFATKNHGYTDTWFAKLNSQGEIIWKGQYGGPGEETEVLQVISDQSGSLYVLGRTSDAIEGSFEGYLSGTPFSNIETWMIKYNSHGFVEKSYRWKHPVGTGISHAKIDLEGSRIYVVNISYFWGPLPGIEWKSFLQVDTAELLKYSFN